MRNYKNKEMDYAQTKEKALRLLEFRNHSKKEIRIKLKNAGATDENIDKVIEFLEEYNLVNDRNYAFSLARDLKNLKKFGKRRIEAELYSKGISQEIISEAVLELGELDTDEFLILVDRRLKGDFEKKNKDRVIRYFINRGYSFDEIKNAISQLEYKNE